MHGNAHPVTITFAMTFMKNQKNIAIIGLLMSASQVLLTAFVGWWLVAQFSEQKGMLKKNLSEQFTKSRDRVIDSVLSKNLIHPALRRRSGNEIEVRISHDSLPDSVIMHREFLPGMKDAKPIGDDIDSATARFMARADSGGQQKMMIHYQLDAGDSLLMHGVKMIVNEVATSSGNKERFDRIISTEADTGLLKKAFDENLQQNRFNFSTHWASDTSRDVLAKKSRDFYFESRLFPYAYGVTISSYNSYLFKKIMPQLFFVLVLLSLTGAAFLIAYRNLKNQVRLGMLKDDFISNISHELKTPVSTVKVAIEALQNFVQEDSAAENQNKPETSKEYLHIASQEMDRLELLIAKVLNSSLLDNGVQVMSFEKINMAQLTEEVLQSLRLRLTSEKAVVNFDRPSTPLYADADKLHVQGVLINLLDNCLKYAEKELTITIRLIDLGPTVSITFADNGPGIPNEFLDKVFEKFFRIPTGNRHKVKGYGLGLSYAKQVMLQHSGSIAVENLPTGGCMFTLTFPKAEA